LKFLVVSSAVLCLLAGAESKAGPPLPPGLAREAAPPIEPVVVFGADGRQTVEQFARAHRLDAGELRRRHAASGLIRCGNARGAGQLTLADTVVTTAAHVLFDEAGRPRADSAHCVFMVEVGREEIVTSIDVASIEAGTRAPYRESAVHDWAVARLKRPLKEATPYELGASAGAGPARFVARGHVDWGDGREMSIEACRMRDALESGAEGTREFAFDCAAGLGASGAALLDPTGARLMAIFVGFRSAEPDARLPFSPRNYNFAVTLEGAFRRAVEVAAAAETAAAR
jgi:hypothetical protein